MKHPLSAGECRVLERLADGVEFKEIAQDFGVTPGTVRRLAVRAYRKLGVDNRYRAVDKHRRLRGHLCQHLRLASETAY